MNVIKTICEETNETLYHLEIDKNYSSLVEILFLALEHAAVTKGKERHANGLPFEKQKICRINRDVGLGFGLGQAIKKIEESVKLSPDRAILELIGAINYLCGVTIVLKEIQIRGDND
jgi:hypothetical protein